MPSPGQPGRKIGIAIIHRQAVLRLDLAIAHSPAAKLYGKARPVPRPKKAHGVVLGALQFSGCSGLPQVWNRQAQRTRQDVDQPPAGGHQADRSVSSPRVTRNRRSFIDHYSTIRSLTPMRSESPERA